MQKKQVKKRYDSKGRILNIGEQERKDGRYMFSYKDDAGKPKYKYANTLPELRNIEKDLNAKTVKGVRLSNNDKTIEYWAEKWEAYKKDTVRITTANGYHDVLYRHIVPDIGKNKIGNLTKNDVKSFYVRLFEKGLALGTVEIVHNVLCMILSYAMDEHAIEKNCASGALKDFGYTKDQNEEVIAFTVEEEQHFLDFIAKTPKYKAWEPMIVFMLGTGCRIGETAGLIWEDINFNKKTVTVSRNLNYKKKADKCEFFFSRESVVKQNASKRKDVITKTAAGKDRQIPLLDKVIEQLKIQKEMQMAKGVDKIDYQLEGFRNFVFTTKNALPQKPNTLNRTLNNIIAECNKQEEMSAFMEDREKVILPHVSVHNLRHTFCTRLCEHCQDLKFIMSVMGHENINTTLKIYYHVQEKNISDNFSKLQDGGFIL
ncbi:tyrosine-type recombinase/integrase [Eisenbergiella tayi]|uniref:tyrosine-type recombinase/integrase n=1 Tax=Eisenbergiella tayi TaxID=1432052 RepID=UPI0008493A01|nr:tyrosine-type recombinase/integrase [Eisenbergiella tayi]ODR38512.1 hypothetical protein BEI60_08585 [Eisenbergiella tayi]